MEDLKQWVCRAQAGDLEAFGVLVRRFQDMAVGYAYSQMGDFHLAEDATQEAFVVAFEGLATLQEPEAFPGWLQRIVFTRCSRMKRKDSRFKIVPLDEVPYMTTSSPGQWKCSNRRSERRLCIRRLMRFQNVMDW